MFIRRIFASLLVVFVSFAMFGRGAATSTPKTPSEIVEQLWTLATEGEFLNSEGWNRYSGFFLHPGPRPEKKMIRVVSNHWAILSASTKASDSDVAVEYAEAGLIDSDLNYKAPQKSPVFKTALLFHLTLAPTRLVMYKSDGKALTGREEQPGPPAWQIAGEQGSPLTTVNTAIRYVLEMREKTNDPKVRKNADLTLSSLLKLN